MESHNGALYGFKYTRTALDGLRAVDLPKRRKKIKAKIDKLAEDPQPPGSRKLRNVDHDGEPIYRIRSGPYRVLYSVSNGPMIVVLDIGHRKDIYR